MNKKMLILPLTAALLAACGSATPPAPVTLSTLTVGGITGPLKIETPAKLTVTATSTDGNPFTGTASFTSSDSNVVAVAADGTLAVRHVSTRPVTLTVTEAGQTASVNVTTYGLDFAGGTYNGDQPTVGTNFTFRFVDAAGNGVPTDVPLSIQGPAGFNKDMPVLTTYAATLKTGTGSFTLTSTPVISGKYTATLTSGGVTYTKTAVVDAQSILPTPKNVTVVPATQNVTVSGTLPVGATRVSVYAYDNTKKAYVANNAVRISTLPSTVAWNTPLTPGSYGILTVARDSFSSADSISGDPFLDQLNASYAYNSAVSVN